MDFIKPQLNNAERMSCLCPDASGSKNVHSDSDLYIKKLTKESVWKQVFFLYMFERRHRDIKQEKFYND